MQLKNLYKTPKTIFVFDASGAFLTAVLLRVLIAQNEDWFGMNAQLAEGLSWIAVGYALYSFLHLMLNPVNWKILLRVIALANLMYCILTIIAVAHSRETITTLGVIYFVGESAIICSLAFIEWKASSNQLKNT